MFRLRCFQDVFPSSRQQILNELFTEKSGNGKVDKVWFHRGHLFVVTNDCSNLVTFDPKEDANQSNLQDEHASKQVTKKQHLDLTFNSPLVSICFSEYSPWMAYLVYNNSRVEIWSYSDSKTDLGWTQINEFTASIGGTDRVTVSAVLCQDVMVFCQVKSSQVYTLCQRRMTGAEKESYYGVFLDNCPACDFHHLQDKLIIWPRYGRSRELVLIWSPLTCSLQIVIATTGVVDQKILVTCCDFKSIILENVKTLSKVEKNSIGIVAMVKHNNEVLFIKEDGSVSSLTNNGDVDNKMKLSLGDGLEMKQVKYWMTYQFTLAAITECNTIRFYSLESGILLYTLDMNDYGHSAIQLVESMDSGIILWNQSAIYQLQMCTQDRLVAEHLKTNDICKLLQRHGDIYIAFQSILEASKQKKDKPMINVAESSISTHVLQSPLSLVAIQKCKNSDNMTQNMKVQKMLEDLIQEQHDNLSCTANRLNEDAGELISQFWTLEQLQKMD